MDIQDLCIYRKLQPQEEPVVPDVIVKTGTFTIENPSTTNFYYFEPDFDVDDIVMVSVESDFDTSKTPTANTCYQTCCLVNSKAISSSTSSSTSYYGVALGKGSDGAAKNSVASVFSIRDGSDDDKVIYLYGDGWTCPLRGDINYTYKIYIANN